MRSVRSLPRVLLVCALSAPAAGLGEEPCVVLPSVEGYYQAGTGDGVGVPLPPASARVEVVVNPQLYASGQVATDMARYVDDVVRQGYEPILTVAEFADAAALRSHLASGYAAGGLAGAVFVGEMPTAYYEIDEHDDVYGYTWAYDSFPCDLYFQDLDGAWTDADADGSYDAHAGDVAPEIWLGRLATGRLTGLHPGRTEDGLLNGYFARNHDYRFGRLEVSRDGLAYIDDDWAGPWGDRWSNELALAVTGSVTQIDHGATTTAADYKMRLKQAREHVLLCAHSNPTLHRFKIGSTWGGGYFLNEDLAGTDPNVLFYNLYACSGARYDTDGFIAGEYVFGTDMGLLAVGSTKTGSMLEFDDYFGPLGEGETFGEAWLNWWTMRAQGGFSESEKDWHYGMTLLGDPLLVTQEYLPIPEPATLTLLAAGAALLLRRRRSAGPGRG